MKTMIFSAALLLGCLTSLHAQELATSTMPETPSSQTKKTAPLSSDLLADYYSLGARYLERKEMDKAQAVFEEYLELAPTEPKAYHSLGDYYMAEGDYFKAAVFYDQAVALGMESSKKGAEKAKDAWAENIK